MNSQGGKQIGRPLAVWLSDGNFTLSLLTQTATRGEVACGLPAWTRTLPPYEEMFARHDRQHVCRRGHHILRRSSSPADWCQVAHAGRAETGKLKGGKGGGRRQHACGLYLLTPASSESHTNTQTHTNTIRGMRHLPSASVCWTGARQYACVSQIRSGMSTCWPDAGIDPAGTPAAIPSFLGSHHE